MLVFCQDDSQVDFDTFELSEISAAHVSYAAIIIITTTIIIVIIVIIVIITTSTISVSIIISDVP